MTAPRKCLGGLVLTLALVALVRAGPPAAPRQGGKASGGQLLPESLAAELKLNDEQRDKISKLEADFKQRRQGALFMTGLKMKGLFDRLDQDDARAAMPVLTIANEVTGALVKMRQTRLEFEKRVMDVLDEQQRAAYAAWLRRSPREKRAERKALRAEMRPLPDLDKELQLTPEQHRKLAEMEREWEQRFRKLLTEEQRRRYDELMRNGPQGQK
jgi:hypothetical protein